jgi:hypothetical protein
MQYSTDKTQHERWQDDLVHLDDLAAQFMIENYSSIKKGSHYDAIKDGFLVGYRLGKQNIVIDEADYIHTQWTQLRIARFRLEQYETRLEAKESKLHTFHAHVRRKLKELKKLKSVLKETFTIKQVD